MSAAASDAKMEGGGPPSTARRDQLLSIERSIQAQWKERGVFNADADPLPRPLSSKYFATFPYPYMNGALHLGHAFTLAKVDYECGYQRLKGKKVCYPFAFHCIAEGAPIALPCGLSRPIEDVVEAQADLQALGFVEDGLLPSHVRTFAAQGVKECLQLTLVDGRTLTCTADHRLLARREGRLEWVQAGQLSCGDVLACGPQFCVDVVGDDEKDWTLPGVCATTDPAQRARTLAFARILGLANSSGCVWGTEASVYVQHPLDVDSLRADIELVCGDSLPAQLNSAPSELAPSAPYQVQLPELLARVIARLPGQMIGERMGQAPTWPAFLDATDTPVAVLREFLAGALGGAGHTAQLVEGKDVQHSLVLTGSTTLEHGQAMLECMETFARWMDQVGVHGCTAELLNTDSSSDGQGLYKYAVRLPTPTDSDAFLERVGFRHSVHKSLRMAAAHSYMRSMQARSHFPSFIDFLRDVGADAWFKEDGTCEAVSCTPRSSMRLPLMLLRVADSCAVGQRRVFDLEVPNADSFTANGVVVHNCTGMPIAASADKVKREIELYGNPPQFPKEDEDDEDADAEGNPDVEEKKAAQKAAGASTNQNGLGRTDEQVRAERKEREHQHQVALEGLTVTAATEGKAKELSPEDLERIAATSATAPIAEEAAAKAAGKRKGKAKLAKKASKKKYQWEILAEMGVKEEDIHLFANPYHWLRYFPPLAKQDLDGFGLCADWRRSFITTQVNPYYDAFIRWQFRTLRKRDKVAFGARLSIFSPIDNQTCADHDRAEGEGVGITDYTLIKIQLLEPYPPTIVKALASLNRSTPPVVFLPAATLRPETMYGQTNLFLLPDGEYGLFEISDSALFVCSAKSALNMSYQDIGRVRGKPTQVGSIKGQELMGCAVKAPLSPYEKVYVLPLLTIRMDKGTGVVTSVPSDAPDDYAALMDLKKKPEWRRKFGIKDEHVMPFEVVPIIDIPGLGTQAAVDLCIAEKVVSQNDRAKLDLIKDRTYKEGFAKGVMIVGEHAGMKVSEAKPKIKAELIAAGLGLAYSEPESRVISRSGNECVVAYSDQWYMKYGEEEWAAQVKHHIETRLETYNPIAKKDFLWVIGWLHHWACSRSYGLGTFLPWDPQYVIESLSDSTIYMAFYTIAHLLQGGLDNVDGHRPGPAGITPDQLTDDVFDYIFLRAQTETAGPPTTSIPLETLERLRAEFEYWYPMDLRVSGKDLIGNHLTFALYHHAAIWNAEPGKWPLSFFTNGHITIDGQKMSKSEGTFITLKEATQEYSADATRFTLADAGDGLEDANFEKKSANAAILKLTKEIAWVEELMPELPNMRRGADQLTFLDRVFLNEMNASIAAADSFYSQLQFRFALKAAFHDLTTYRDAYRGNVGAMHGDVLRRYLEVSILLLAPICPHYAQHLWTLTRLDQQLHCPFVAHARWPQSEPVDLILSRQSVYLRETNVALRKAYIEQVAKLSKTKKKEAKDINKAAQIVDTSALSHLILVAAPRYPDWQRTVLTRMAELYAVSKPELPSRKGVVDAVKFDHAGEKDKKKLEQATKFAGSVLEEMAVRGEAALELELPFDERSLLEGQLALVVREVPVDEKNVRIVSSEEAENIGVPAAATAAQKALPGKPTFAFYHQE